MRATVTAAALAILGGTVCPVRAGTFSTALGGTGLDVRGAGASACGDSGACVVVTAMDYEGYSFGEPWIVSIDESGDAGWRMVLGREVAASRDLEAGGLLEPLSGGSFLVAVHGEPRATGVDADACILKVQPGSGVEWARVIGIADEGVYAVTDLVPFADGSFAAAYNKGCGSWTPFVSLYRSDGGLTGTVALSDSGGFVHAADATPDGRLLTACSAGWWPEIRLYWIDPRDLSIEDTRIVTETCGEVRGMDVDGSGTVMLCGSDDGHPWAACVDSEGGLLWRETLDGQGYLAGVTATADGGACFCGALSRCGLVVRYTAEGARTWTRCYEAGGYSSFEEIAPSPWGGYILSGSTSAGSDEMGGGRAWIQAVDEEGLIDGCACDQVTGIYHPAIDFQQLYRPREGWTIACGVFDSVERAWQAADAAAAASGLEPDVVWIPEWPSLSGYEGWLACLVPDGLDGSGWEETAAAIIAECPDAYMVWLGMTSENRRRELVTGE